MKRGIARVATTALASGGLGVASLALGAAAQTDTFGIDVGSSTINGVFLTERGPTNVPTPSPGLCPPAFTTTVQLRHRPVHRHTHSLSVGADG